MDDFVDFRNFFGSVSEIWILTDPAGNIVFTSHALARFNDIIHPPLQRGVSIFESIPDSWKKLADNVLSTLVYSKMPSTLEASCMHEGKEIHFEIKCTAIRSDTGVVENIFIEARDVTPQKIFEKKITIVAREYQSVIENANAVIIGTDARGYITEWNEMAQQVTGYTKNDSYIRKLSEFLDPGSRERFAAAINKVLNGDVIANYEMVIQAKDGHVLTLLANATPRTSATSEVVGILLIGQDITELSAYRKSLEQRVMERTKALKAALENEKKLVEVRNRFVSMASHEFRSPISYIHKHIGAMKENIDRLSAAELKARLSKIDRKSVV